MDAFDNCRVNQARPPHDQQRCFDRSYELGVCCRCVSAAAVWFQSVRRPPMSGSGRVGNERWRPVGPRQSRRRVYQRRPAATAQLVPVLLQTTGLQVTPNHNGRSYALSSGPAAEEVQMSEARPPHPPFTEETAIQKIRAAEDAWNTRDPERVSLAYTVDSKWR